MKCQVVILAILCAIWTVPTTTIARGTPPKETPKATNHGNQGQEKTSYQPPAAQTKNSIKPQTPPTPKTTTTNNENSAGPDWWSRTSGVIAAIGTVALAIIAVVASCVAIKTLRIMVRQTAANIRAADAALLNAQAVIDSERAWLVPAAEFIKPAVLPAVNLFNSQIETVTIRIENCGPTPAWLTDWFAHVEVLDDTNVGQFTNAGQPEGDFPNARPFPQRRIEEFSCQWETNWPEVAAIRSGQKHLYIYGFVEYRSIAGNKPHISRFCFHYFHRRNNIGSFDEGWIADPPEENYYT